MLEVVELAPTLQALAIHLGIKDERRISVERYCYDSRIKWDTYVVTVDGQGVGFTDGPVDSIANR